MKRPIAILVAAVIITAVFFVSSLSFGETDSKGQATFDKNIQYDVYYTVSDFEVHVVRQVAIEGTASLGEREYLIVRGATARSTRSTPSEMSTDGYILSEAVRAILPSEMPKPERLLRTNEH